MNNSDRFQVLQRDATDFTAKDYDPAVARSRLHQRERPPALHEFEESARYYRPSDSLVTAINTAVAVEAPLLLTGEPGTGKTQVAYYLQRYFGISLFTYQVRSTSTVEDMKYDFDAVGYLHYAQHGDEKGEERTRNDFVTPNALWNAFENQETRVLLIDEIDKAPRDFPNDLLQELDQYCFKHPFEDRQVPADPPSQRPIVIITRNVERRLPDAFLRRCMYHHIELTPELVDRAVAARLGCRRHTRLPESGSGNAGKGQRLFLGDRPQRADPEKTVHRRIAGLADGVERNASDGAATGCRQPDDAARFVDPDQGQGRPGSAG